VTPNRAAGPIPAIFRASLRRLLIGASITALVITHARAATAESELSDAAFGRAELQGRMAANGILEASGIAVSHRRADLLWVLNDSGNTPDIFAVSTNGSDLGEVRVRNAVNCDWEDMASYVLGGKAFLLIADVGDNPSKREDCVLYVVDEPEAPGEGIKSESSAPIIMRFRYEDGPRDCEAVGVDVAGRRILLVSKRTQPPVLYELPLPEADAPAPATASRIGVIPHLPPPDSYDRNIFGSGVRFAAQPTALDIAPDGRSALLMNYREAYIFGRQEGQSWAECTAARPLRVRLPQVRGKEAACFGAEGRDIWVTVEGPHPPLFLLRSSR
jgi:hypothetical protein